MVIILMAIGEYFIVGYSICKPLVVILLMVINGCCIISYCWLLYVLL
jgi:hypothetical protein